MRFLFGEGAGSIYWNGWIGGRLGVTYVVEDGVCSLTRPPTEDWVVTVQAGDIFVEALWSASLPNRSIGWLGGSSLVAVVLIPDVGLDSDSSSIAGDSAFE